MSGLDTALAKNPWMDRTALGAAGGSYGGYMVNWIAGHTDRFKALVRTPASSTSRAMDGATEELWFPDWEFGGFTDPRRCPTQYREVLAAPLREELQDADAGDARVSSTIACRTPKSLQLFTALQRQDVPSRLVVFPDEGHWIGKPQNQRLWWNEVQGWMKKYLSSTGRSLGSTAVRPAPS